MGAPPFRAAASWSPPERFGEYRLERLLGRGAMGHVYLAQDLLLDRPVAVKFLAASEPSEAARRYFVIEARAIARLSHPNVVSIYRVGEVDRRPYLVSEFVRGRSLDQLELPLESREVLAIGVSLARGLAAAHQRGVLHRDIKPANAILAEGGQAKLLDFGVAKLLDVDAPVPLAEPAHAAVGVTGTVVGTPLYLAPELWRGDAATPRSDIYSLGVLLYELCVGRAPFAGLSLADLAAAAGARAIPALGDEAPHIERPLAAVIERCLEPDPAARFASADELRAALEEQTTQRRTLAPIAGNPYRGLAPFEADHRDLFFGRETEVRAIVERLRSDPFVLIVGDSGVGKSSLVRAGVLPLLRDGALGGEAEPAILTLTPGRRPIAALATALAPWIGDDEAALAERLGRDPEALAARLRQGSGGPRAVLFVDQFEELLTLAEPAEAAAAAEALAALAGGVPQLALLATVRSDFLARLSALPRLGDGVTRAFYLLRPLSADGVREAIVAPAALVGAHFESEALVDELVASSSDAAGELPLLQFALAQLWERRDRERGTISASALVALGGVAGALAGYADGILGLLLPEQRLLVRRILVGLVTPEGTRARRTARELIADESSERAAQAVLERLVQGRLLTAQEGGFADAPTFQIAHEALVHGWATLQAWRAQELGHGAVRQRLRRAAEEWQRLGRPADGLWHRGQLAEAAELDARELGANEAAFVTESRRAARRRRLWRHALIFGVPLLLGLGYAGARASAMLHLERAMAQLLGAAATAQQAARAGDDVSAGSQKLAFAAFDRHQSGAGEAAWERSRAQQAEANVAWARAGELFERALALDGTRRDVRRRFADLLEEQARQAERDHRLAERDGLVRRMLAYDDDGAHQARWNAPARVAVESSPANAAVDLQRVVDDGERRTLETPQALGTTPLPERALAPGSYVLTLRAAGRPPVRYPLLVARGEQLRVAVRLPASVPEGYVFVPAGRFLYGTTDGEEMRRLMLTAQPLHPVWSDAFLIARHEVTFGDWIAFLRAIDPAERRQRLPSTPVQISGSTNQRVALTETGDRFRLLLQPTTRAYSAAMGEPIRYPERAMRHEQDWLRMPVSGISWVDARAYAAWLDRSGRLPGARLCDEHEWERAARGADDRLFPGGNRLRPDDADVDETYGRKPLAFGPDEVGAHPASDSPFGVADLAGNTWELVASVSGDETVVIRGGSWYNLQIVARADNREPADPSLRAPLVGTRICATVAP